MNEQQRMQYLDAMGIDMFVPRYVLPNALASKPCLLPVAPVAKAAKTANDSTRSHAPINTNELLASVKEAALPTPDTFNEPASQPSSPHEHRPSVLDSSKPIVAPQKVISPLVDIDTSSVTESLNLSNDAAPVVASSDSQDAEPAHFLLQLWRISDDLLVIDSKVQSEPLPTDRLLANLLFAMRLHRGSLPIADKLQWPLVNSASKDKSWHAAQEMTHYFLEGRLFTSPVKYIFLCGDLAQKAILKQPIIKDVSALAQPSQEACQKVSVDAFACEAYCFPSLNTMLKAPMLKRYVWQLLSKDFALDAPD